MQPQWKLQVVEVPITVSTSAYTAGDAVGGLLTSNAVEQVKGGGYIAWARLIDDADQTEGFDLWCFYESPTSISDADPFTMVEADWSKLVTVIEVVTGDYDQTGDEACALVNGKDKSTGEYMIFPNLSDGRLYCYLVASDTPDYADADDLTLHLGIMVM